MKDVGSKKLIEMIGASDECVKAGIENEEEVLRAIEGWDVDRIWGDGKRCIAWNGNNKDKMVGLNVSGVRGYFELEYRLVEDKKKRCFVNYLIEGSMMGFWRGEGAKVRRIGTWVDLW